MELGISFWTCHDLNPGPGHIHSRRTKASVQLKETWLDSFLSIARWKQTAFLAPASNAESHW